MSSIHFVAQGSYHHGDLRRAVIAGALAAIAEHGPAAFSLRDVARRAGVSHAAPAHHFGDKAGVLTAIATEGFELLSAATRAATEQTGSLIEGGIAYIRFALEHPAYYEVMFRPDLYHRHDEALITARDAAANVLANAVRRSLGPDASEQDVLAGVIASWSFAHGFANLWAGGNFQLLADSHPEELARHAANAFVQLVLAGAQSSAATEPAAIASRPTRSREQTR
jgi:AcrR family transcriptional regulator